MYRESHLPYRKKDVKQCIKSAQTTFDFCMRRYERAMAAKQVGDVLPVPEERDYMKAKENLVEAHRCDLPKAKAVYRNEKKRIRIIKKLLQSMEATESNPGRKNRKQLVIYDKSM